MNNITVNGVLLKTKVYLVEAMTNHKIFRQIISIPFMNNPVLRYVFLFLAAFLLTGMVFFAGCTGTPPATGKLDGFDDFVTAKMTEYEVPGAVVGIVENDTVVVPERVRRPGDRKAGRRLIPTPASRSHRSPSMSPPVRSARSSTRENWTGTRRLSRTCRALR